MIAKEQGESKADEASEEVIYKIDVPANRFGILLCKICNIYQKLGICIH